MADTVPIPSSEETNDIVHDMDLGARTLGGLSINVLRVEHEKDRVYPATVVAECFEGDSSWPMANSPDDFIKLLSRVLRSGHVKSIINSLLAKINEQGRADASA